jgi:electron transfer flavoprotein-quinone oxidoreductase
LVVVGDAAGFTLNTGFTVRGMDLAAGSAKAAAEAIGDALDAGDTTEGSLRRYIQNYEASFVGADMKTYQRMPEFLENEEMYSRLGAFAADVFFGIYNLNLEPRVHLARVIWRALKESEIGLRRLAALGFRGLRAL